MNPSTNHRWRLKRFKRSRVKEVFEKTARFTRRVQINNAGRKRSNRRSAGSGKSYEHEVAVWTPSASYLYFERSIFFILIRGRVLLSPPSAASPSVEWTFKFIKIADLDGQLTSAPNASVSWFALLFLVHKVVLISTLAAHLLMTTFDWVVTAVSAVLFTHSTNCDRLENYFLALGNLLS